MSSPRHNANRHPAPRPQSPTVRPLSPSGSGGRSLSPRRFPRSTNGIPPKPSETELLMGEGDNAKPPIAATEIDEYDVDNRETVNKPYPGVDDGFFSTEGSNNPDDSELIPDISTRVGGDTDVDDKEIPINPPSDGGNMPRGRFPVSPGGNRPEKPFPKFPESEFGEGSIPDINLYQQKKTMAQGMMDLALFSANANQLRYVLESSGHPYFYPGLTLIGISLILQKKTTAQGMMDIALFSANVNQLRYVLENNAHPYFYSDIALISVSLILQVLVGIGLIWNARYNVKDDRQICIANKINNFTIVGIFLITVINVFISAFGTTSTTVIAQPPFGQLKDSSVETATKTVP